MRISSSLVYDFLEEVKSLCKNTTEITEERLKEFDWEKPFDRRNIKNLLKTTSQSYEVSLRDITYLGIAASAIKVIDKYGRDKIDIDKAIDETIKEIQKPFKGHTLDFRIKRISNIISVSGERLINAGLDIKPQWMGKQSFTTGGSLYKQSIRLVASEMYRTNQMATLVTAGLLGVKRVQWALDSSHHIFDICDYLVGTYDIDKCPDYPHPYCKCHILPLF